MPQQCGISEEEMPAFVINAVAHPKLGRCHLQSGVKPPAGMLAHEVELVPWMEAGHGWVAWQKRQQCIGPGKRSDDKDGIGN